MNNLVIDHSDMIKIPNVIIKKSETWQWSIEIHFDVTLKINYFDIFNTLKSYAWNSIIPCYSISFGKKDESGLIICEKENINKIKKINLKDFNEWLNWRISTDKHYKIKSNFYYILLSFEKKICEEESIDLNSLKPIYPWKKEWMDFLKTDENRIEYLENLLKTAEKKIEKLEEELKKKK